MPFSWPIIETHDTSDFTQADEYVFESEYIWLKQRGIQIRDDFPYGWIPDDNEQTNIHSFPYCKADTNIVIRRDVLRLVPTDQTNRSYNINQSLIAGYDKNFFSIFIIDRGIGDSSDTLPELLKRFPNAYVITKPDDNRELSRQVIKNTNSQYVWLIDAAMQLYDDFELYYDPIASTQMIYAWNTENECHPTAYPNWSLLLLPITWFINYGKGDYDITVVDDVAGYIDNASVPDIAYMMAFRESVILCKYDLLKIAQLKKTNMSHQSHPYVYHGTIDGIEWYNDNKYNTEILEMVNDFSWLQYRYYQFFQKFVEQTS